jgi:FlaA1/EpsC-like NDP-sugar epimerase
MTRYFMTIPDAVRLVLEATTLAFEGDVFMLDMGDPVRIRDFANEIIELSGLTPGKDIDIEITGIRPGEKLHEQLWNEGAEVSATEFSHVFRVKASAVDETFRPLLQELIGAASLREAEKVRKILSTLPIGFGIAKNEPSLAILRNRQIVSTTGKGATCPGAVAGEP